MHVIHFCDSFYDSTLRGAQGAGNLPQQLKFTLLGIHDAKKRYVTRSRSYEWALICQHYEQEDAHANN